MTASRLAAIQRDLGLHVEVIAVKGRPGSVQPRVVYWHWTATFSSPNRPFPTRNIIINGMKNLPGPIYGDAIPWQNNPNQYKVALITVGRHNHAGMGHLSTVSTAAAGNGNSLPRQPRYGDTQGMNGISVGVSVDYHPNQGPPTPEMIEAMVRALAARCIYHGLSPHAILDHAQATRRKIDNMQHWPTPQEIRSRVASIVNSPSPKPKPEPKPEVDDDMMIIVRRRDDGTNWLVNGGWRIRLDDLSLRDRLLRAGAVDEGEWSSTALNHFPWNRPGTTTWPEPLTSAAKADFKAESIMEQ